MTFSPSLATLALYAALLGTSLAGNLVRNGGFDAPGTATAPQPALTVPDNRIPSWGMDAEWYVDKSEKSPVPGALVLRVNGNKEIHGVLRQQIYLEPGVSYTLSGWVKAEGLIKTGLEQGDARSSIMVTNWNWSKSFVLSSGDAFTPEWKRYTMTFVAPDEYLVAGVRQPCHLRVYLPKGETGRLWVTGLQLEEGDTATEFERVSVTEREELTGELQSRLARIEASGEAFAKFEGAEAFLSRQKESRTRIEALLQKLSKPTASWHALASQARALLQQTAPLTQPVVWWENAWRDLGRRVLPQGIPTPEERKFRITLGQNDYGAVLLPVGNPHGDSMAVEVSVGEDVAPFSTQTPWTGPITVSEVRMVSNEGYKNVLSPVKEHKEFPYFFESLGNGNTILLPGAETAQLWFDIRTKDIAPGVYRYPVRLKGLLGEFLWDGEIELEVLPVPLPERVPANVISYATMPFYMEPFAPYGAGRPILKMTPEERRKLAEPWLKAWKEMGFNRLMLTTQYLQVGFNENGGLAGEIDYSMFDAYHDLWSSIGADVWGGYNLAAYHVYSSWKETAKLIPGDLARERTKSLFQSLVSHARELGMTGESFPICMFDEPHGPRVGITRQGVEALKEVAPDWKVISTVAGTKELHVRELVPLLDIFVVRQRMGNMDMDPAGIRYLQSQGKEVWGYSCSGSFEYMNPYRYFRLLPWQAWNNGLTGYGVYMSIDVKQYPRIGPRSSFYSPLFLGRDGPVMGKGARGFQLGGRDWSLFTLTRNLVEELKARGAQEDAKALEKKLKFAVRSTLAAEEDATKADTARTELLRELAARRSHP